MQHTNLIVPGFHGGGEAHWPTWLERRLDNVRRVCGIAWEAPLLGPAGHINIESGHGPWPLGFELLQAMQHAQEDFPRGTIGEPCLSRHGRHGALARIRHRTRFVFNRQAAGRDRPTPEG